MAQIFISHSSKDINVAEQLANDLRKNGHWVWLDSWRIKVGQCIIQEIEQGIESADCVIVLLSIHAVDSKWVDREWKTAYWDEVNNDSIIILPACIEKCKIPKLLQTKKYAAFYKSYDQGLSELLDALYYYEITKLNADFFHAINKVRADLVDVSDDFAVHRHNHWDKFQNTVDSLTEPNKRNVQRLNTQFYLEEWHLSVSQLKKELHFLGVYNGKVDDMLTDDVLDAIILFQRNHNLRHIDGVFGPLTYSEMEKVAKSITTW